MPAPKAIARCAAVATALAFCLLLAAPVAALIYAQPDFEASIDQLPADFPYWDHVTQRRYEGPSVLYLGQGWALTAKHVGVGEIFLQGEIIPPETGSRHTLLNVDGSPADLMVFELKRGADLPQLPLLPLAREPARSGEEVLIIGFGRGGGERLELVGENGKENVVRWTLEGAKRWGTNRIGGGPRWITQQTWLTRAFAMRFDRLDAEAATPYEAQAASGDSGGAVFVKRDGAWQLAGVMVSVAGIAHAEGGVAAFGDQTFAADVSSYRNEIIRWTRPSCANEEDDDGDGEIDYPADLGCSTLTDEDEREVATLRIDAAWTRWLGTVSVAILIGLWATGQNAERGSERGARRGPLQVARERFKQKTSGRA